MNNIDAIVTDISQALEVANKARDNALTESRRIVRLAANTIRALHRGQIADAEEQLATARTALLAVRVALNAHPDIYWAGYFQDAQKELAEAHILSAMISAKPLPTPQSVGIEGAPYLNGMAEAASELRRYILDIIRRGGEVEILEAERALAIMDDVYTRLIAVDYPDALTGGLRRTTDQLRGVLERTRGDLTLTIRQAELSRALSEARHPL